LFVTAIQAAYQSQRSKSTTILLYPGEVAFALHAVETPLKDAGTRLLNDSAYNRTNYDLARERLKSMLARHPRFYDQKKEGYCFAKGITIGSAMVESLGAAQ
jgi:hypothetical protein